jgi:hypothetical protein
MSIRTLLALAVIAVAPAAGPAPSGSPRGTLVPLRPLKAGGGLKSPTPLQAINSEDGLAAT